MLDYALWLSLRRANMQSLPVLILVVLDYALWLSGQTLTKKETKGLNPCCAGLCSLTVQVGVGTERNAVVLILVVLDYALWPKEEVTCVYCIESLNPCCAGLCSLTELGRRFALRPPSLNPCCAGLCSLTTRIQEIQMPISPSLNPCCAGLCSLTRPAHHESRTRGMS